MVVGEGSESERTVEEVGKVVALDDGGGVAAFDRDRSRRSQGDVEGKERYDGRLHYKLNRFVGFVGSALLVVKGSVVDNVKLQKFDALFIPFKITRSTSTFRGWMWSLERSQACVTARVLHRELVQRGGSEKRVPYA